MSSLRSIARSRSQETSRATLSVGLITKIILDTGVVSKFAKANTKVKTFASYENHKTEEEARLECINLAKQVLGDDSPKVMPCLFLEIVPPALTPTKMTTRFISMEGNALKREGEFLLDHMSDEFDDLIGKPTWAHIQWVRLPEGDYGGDYSLSGDDAGNELGLVITYIENKKAALKLLEDLRDGNVTLDSLASAAGFDRGHYLRNRSKKDGDSKKDFKAPTMTSIGPITTKNYITLEEFTSPDTFGFIQDTYKTSGDVEKTATTWKANPGDIALLVADKKYFTDLMAATGKGEQEALAEVSKELSVTAKDVAALLGIDEPAF